ncbi:FAD-dependent oxidoreductase [Saccharopolyspora halophila]|uniref:FAD-dependent oxidoreductase n=1 Tax=Saccharopolyspora halophila TaxID=405551 RepID=UPI0031DAFF95
MTEPPVLVIGAGVQGLTCGVVLAEAGNRVRIRTTDPPRATTSAAAGAMWAPTMASPSDRAPHWAALSHAEFTELADDDDTGVHLSKGRIAARYGLGEALPAEARLIPDLQRCGPQDLPAGFADGFRGTVPLIDMPRYLDYLVARFRGAGGEIARSAVQSCDEAIAESGAVVNCSGVGAHELVGDPGVYPVFGQLVVVRNPGVDEYFIELTESGEFISAMPHGDRLLLGGVKFAQDWGTRPRPRVREGILRRCAALDPRLAEAEVLDELVGLRPGRQSVRVQLERYSGARIVHNYGHGGNGVALSWGCAYEVAELLAS